MSEKNEAQELRLLIDQDEQTFLDITAVLASHRSGLCHGLYATV